jgi:shikimate dehydrogenase
MAPISGQTLVTGIIGWPVEASLSPAIHNAAFAAMGLDWVYVAFGVPAGSVGAAMDGMRALGVQGLNVTMPHKQAVIPHLDGLEEEARRAGAVNTITRHGDRLVGTNTDGSGFLRFLDRDAGWTPKGQTAVVLGAGGAARAVTLALADAGASVAVAARRAEQAEEVSSLAPGARSLEWIPDVIAEAVAAADLFVNATPIGRNGEDLPFDGGAFGDRLVVVDLVYHPKETALVRTAAARGARAFNGLGMLVHQAAIAFEIWTGVAAPVEAMSSAVR